MVEKYIIDKTDIHDLLTGQELPLSQGKARAFCVEIAGELTNGELIKALFPNFDVEDKTEYFGRIRNLDDHFIKTDIDFWNSPYKAEGVKKWLN